MDPTNRPRPADLLAELTRLHELLSEPASEHGAIPVLQDVVSPAPEHSLQQLQPLLMQSADDLLQEVIQEFTPQITAELEKRLHQHLQQLVREQEQLRQPQTEASTAESDTSAQPVHSPHSPYSSLE